MDEIMDTDMHFRTQLQQRDLLWGPFFTSGDIVAAEAIGRIDCDAVCVDLEHGLFDQRDLSACILALKSAQKYVIIRVRQNEPSLIGQALDLGADAILCPHVNTKADAKRLAAACRYKTGRGYSGATRANGFGARGMDTHCDTEDARVAVIAQIEDAEAVENIDSICAVEGLDAIFIGRSDLTVSMGHRDRNHSDVIKAVETVAASGQAAGLAVGTFTAELSEIAHWQQCGISLFLLGSQIGFMVSGGQAFAECFRNAADS